MRPIDRLPEPARKANAYRMTLGVVMGFDLETQIFLACPDIIDAPPAPAGQVYLSAILSLAGDPTRINFCAVAGTVDRAWWAGPGRGELIEAWNQLSQEERLLERQRWVSEADAFLMARALLERGCVPPNIDFNTN